MANGRWLAEWLVDNAPRIPVRDRATLEAQYAKQGPELVDEVIRAASRSSAAVGASVGVLVGTEQFVPPAWLAIPMELISETVAIAIIELKLVAELHGIFERPMPTSPAQRNLALVMAWAERRGVSPATLTHRGGVADALGRRARAEAIRVVRRRLAGRLGRNLSSLAPLLAGAVAGAEINRFLVHVLRRPQIVHVRAFVPIVAAPGLDHVLAERGVEMVATGPAEDQIAPLRAADRVVAASADDSC